MDCGTTRLRSFLLVLVSLLLADLGAGQSECNVNLGDALSAGSSSHSWPSPSAEFAFGFRVLPSASSSLKDLFFLAIWFNKIPEQTIIWSENDHPVQVGSQVQLSKEGHLVLYDQQGNEVWRATDEKASCGSMLDSGNFALRSEDSKYLWESFKFPTDTILPGQRLSMGGTLTSRLSETNYTEGRFQLQMQSDGNLVLYTIFLPTRYKSGAYWESMTGTSGPMSNSVLVFDEAGYIYIEQNDKTVYNVTKKVLGSKQDCYYLARIDEDGVFRQYDHPRKNYVADRRSCISSWRVIQRIPEDICTAVMGYMDSGACGYNSYCVNLDGKPACRCPEGYSPLDPLLMQRGCKPNFQLPSCQENGWESNVELIEFKELNNTDWPLNDYELQTGSDVDKEKCKEFCLYDCYCAAAIYHGNRCWKKKFPLSNGKQSLDLDRMALIKVPRGNVASLCSKSKDKSSIILIGSFLLGSSAFLNLVLLLITSVFVYLSYRKKLLNFQTDSTSFGIKKFTYKELEQATGGFKLQLGRGSFGTVYKGVLPLNSRKHIAVKRLDKSVEDGEKEFKTEVRVIGQTHHKNLVNLLGFCDAGVNRLLVYEYMSNGSLASFLFGISRPHWNQRVQIALGIARGLTYLHEECSTQIIHCDVKPQNVLLDESFTPKISDFGLAKLLLTEQSRATRTNIRGTVGYFAPEWFRKASITVKVDVYSFGVMLLEIICCKSSVRFSMSEEDETLVDWAYECYSKRKTQRLVENDEDAKNDMTNVERMAMVAIWCIQEDPSLRPSMRRVTQMLEGVSIVPIPPRPLLFYSSSISSLNESLI